MTSTIPQHVAPTICLDLNTCAMKRQKLHCIWIFPNYIGLVFSTIPSLYLIGFGFALVTISTLSTHAGEIFFSFFGKAFEQAASSTNSRTKHDSFDSHSKSSVSFPLFPMLLKHLSPNLAIFPLCNAAMGGAMLIIACHVNTHSPDSKKTRYHYLPVKERDAAAYCCHR